MSENMKWQYNISDAANAGLGISTATQFSLINDKSPILKFLLKLPMFNIIFD